MLVNKCATYRKIALNYKQPPSFNQVPPSKILLVKLGLELSRLK